MVVDAFKEVREKVSAEDVARRYGIEIDQRGKARCPFHCDHHPSMSFRCGRYRCWSCGAAGSSIDMAVHLLGLTPSDAVKQLNIDFALGIHFDRELTEGERREVQRRREVVEVHKAFEEWRSGFIGVLCAAIREGNIALRGAAGLDKLTDREALAVRINATFEYWADTLSCGTPEEQAHIYQERWQITRWTEKVLNN